MSPRDPYSRVDYRRLIAWPERMKREGPFLDRLLADAPAKRILDLGCGTGEHSRLLVSRGFSVTAVDASASMLGKLREQPVPDELEVVHGDFVEVEGITRGSYGGAICLGNALPHVQGRERLERFFTGLRQRLLPGAPFLLQVLAYDRIFNLHERALPINFRPDPNDAANSVVFLRLMDPRPDGTVIFCPTTLRFRPDAEPPVEVVSSKRVPLRGWRRAEIEAALARAGFDRWEVFGSYAREVFDPRTSRDLIVVARGR